MKKTLLIAAAALAAGVISSEAQVYSQNIVGYANSVIKGGNKLTMLCNPLAGTTNGANGVLLGLNPSGGEVVYIWNGAGYYAYLFQGYGVGTGLGQPSDYTDPNGGTAAAIPGDINDTANGVYWTAAAPQLKQGQGFFIQNPNATDDTNTFVGNVVLQNTNTPTIIAGNNALSLVASTPAIGGALTNAAFNLPLVGGETIYLWNGSGYYAYLFQGPGVGTGLGEPSDYTDPNGGTAAGIPGSINDTANGVYWAPAPPSVNVGVGFFIQNPSTTPLSWKQNLIVQ